jgi:hypothetical protein
MKTVMLYIPILKSACQAGFLKNEFFLIENKNAA